MAGVYKLFVGGGTLLEVSLSRLRGSRRQLRVVKLVWRRALWLLLYINNIQVWFFRSLLANLPSRLRSTHGKLFVNFLG